MKRPFFALCFYCVFFGTIIHYVAKIAEFSEQETRLLYLFTGILIFSSIVVPIIEEKIQSHNENAKRLIEEEHAQLKKKLDKKDEV